MEEPQPARALRGCWRNGVGRSTRRSRSRRGGANAARHLHDGRARVGVLSGRQVPDARAASLQAMRTGSMDRRIRCHAKAIERAVQTAAP